MLLVLSLLVLAIAPLLFRLAQGRRSAVAALDGFVFVVVGGMLVLLVIPDSLRHAGYWAVLVAAVGFAGPNLLERALARSAHHAHLAALGIAVMGLVVHGFVDGVALRAGGSSDATQRALAVAVVAHRLPIGLTLWWLLRPVHGPRIAIAALAAIGLATVAGYLAGPIVLDGMSSRMALFQALVAGSLLHVLVHYPRPELALPTAGGWRLHAGLGGAAAIAFLYFLLRTGHGVHDHGAVALAPYRLDEVWRHFLSLAAESAPALLFAYAGAGLLHAFLPRATVRWMGRGSPVSQALRGVAFGLPLPLCSCGVIPLYRSLVLRGTAVSSAMAFLVATPEIGLDAVLLSFPLLGLKMTVARVAAAAVVAVLVGWIVGRLAERLKGQPVQAAAPSEEMRDWPLRLRLREAIRAGFVDLLDSTGPWILLGLVLAAIAAPLLDAAWIGQVPKGVGVALFALIGMPVYVCASGATPLVAMLIFKGVSPGAALAFLLTGPATNATTFGVLSDLHGRRVALVFGLSVALLATGLGYLLNALVVSVEVFVPPEGHLHLSAFRMACLLALAALFALSILRQGPRHFAGRIVRWARSDAGTSGPAPGTERQRSTCCGTGQSRAPSIEEEPPDQGVDDRPPSSGGCCH